MPIRSYGITDVGRKRDHNEDSFFISDDLGLYVVADGMGGHAAGEVASAKAVEVIRDFVRRCQEDDEFTWPYGINPEFDELQNTLVTSVKLANREVWRLAQEKADHHGMGTTIATFHVSGTKAAIAHVGDSRVYLVRDGKLEQRTRDHSWVNEQLVRGIISPEEAKVHRWKNVITRALGNREQVEVDVSLLELKPDDILLICSDGLCAGEKVDEAEILRAIVEHKDDLTTAAKLLIGMANDIGGPDNITVVLARQYATEEQAREAGRDRSAEDTNPMLQSKAMLQAANLEKTADMSAKDVLSAIAADSPNHLDEPIPFEDEDADTPALGTARKSTEERELGEIFEEDLDHPKK